MKVLYIGNFRPQHSTENALAWGLRRAGVEVEPWQQEEASTRSTRDARNVAEFVGADLVLYTRTHNPTALGHGWTDVWADLEARGVRTASFHLDLFWGLAREHLIADRDPLFTTGLVVTADGGSDERWAAAGIEHAWLPPAFDSRPCSTVGKPSDLYAGRVVFLGSGARYHSEWPHRQEMLRYLRRRYGSRFLHIGPDGDLPSLRGCDLADLYASEPVFVGDHCFAGRRSRYWSDRLPETLGRGGLLAYTYTSGMPEHWLAPGDDFAPWQAEDWYSLAGAIEFLDGLGQDEAAAMRARARQVVAVHHTYEVRARQLLRLLRLDPADAV
jgi:hypothetical protein